MGDVYEVNDERHGRRVLKLLEPQLARRPELRARFEMEARTPGAQDCDAGRRPWSVWHGRTATQSAS
jgi:hypothetical protein